MVSTIIKYTLESFSERTGVSNVVEVGRKSVPGGWATVGETSFSKSSSCSWQPVVTVNTVTESLLTTVFVRSEKQQLSAVSVLVECAAAAAVDVDVGWSHVQPTEHVGRHGKHGHVSQTVGCGDWQGSQQPTGLYTAIPANHNNRTK